MISARPFLSIIIPVFNEQRYIGSCLDSIFQNDIERHFYEVIVVDNGSVDDTVAIVNRYEVSLWVDEASNVGGVRNYGAKKAVGENLVFLDADCVIDEGWISRAVGRISKSKNNVYGGQYLLRENPSWLEKNWVLNDNSETVEQTTLVGGCIVIPKEIFDDAGGFDERLVSGEDSELTNRLRRQGYVVEIDPALSVIHLGYPATVVEFLRRQIWHSLDYIRNFPKSLFDKVFLVTLVFIVGFFFIFFAIFWGPYCFGFGSSLILLSTLALSAKRIGRSGKKVVKASRLLPIFAVDFLYLLGRSLGVLSGLARLLGVRFLYFEKG
ncbi:Glycosyltransferase, GT2 family [Marinobacter sp. es.042]|uniref:glycosyltransferase n=1 Tax=Marinobacter sp. es.042 TaxID=1761794 RepID=UPI000B611EFD|nr:glycosyltransferase [Marinobacter sp. es.042]SNB55494.1 Glycosyltransferase, GT2 family [Marinobacter sp. es.042]